MKTITPGKASDRTNQPWWVGRIVTCPHCHGQFEIEPNDEIQAVTLLPPLCASIVCPTQGCGAVISFTDES